MARVHVEIEPRKLAEVERLLRDIPRGVPRALSGAINDTSRRQRTQFSRQIRERVNIKKRDIDRQITVKKSTVKTLSGWIRIESSRRLSLSYFGGRQTKKGITYRINKKGGRQFIASAFMVQKKYLKNAPPDATGEISFRRQGKKRLKIVALKGPTAYAVFLENDLLEPGERDTAAELSRNLDRRVNVLILKHRGQI